MRGLKKALLLAATRLPMDGKDIPGDAEKKQELAFKAVADNSKKKRTRERIRTFRGAATKVADTVGNSTCARGGHSPTSL